eukprot:Lankesteria_metandrocarpae@DN9695_c0_g1_i1.p1
MVMAYCSSRRARIAARDAARTATGGTATGSKTQSLQARPLMLGSLSAALLLRTTGLMWTLWWFPTKCGWTPVGDNRFNTGGMTAVTGGMLGNTNTDRGLLHEIALNTFLNRTTGTKTATVNYYNHLNTTANDAGTRLFDTGTLFCSTNQTATGGTGADIFRDRERNGGVANRTLLQNRTKRDGTATGGT